MKIRAIPFGYRYDNGKIVIDKTTSDVVKEIFSLYVKGKSLLDISSLLNNMHIEYRPGVIGWNKARIKRIIEDKRYLGDKDFPVIVSEDVASKANYLKTKKNTQSNIDKDNLIYRLDAPVYCPCCNTLMKRIYEPRNKIPERWRCENSECHHIIAIADTDLLSELQQLLNSIIINPDMIESHVSENYISMETFRTENEINHLLDSRSINRVCYGYQKNENGELVIFQEQAEVVGLIFDLYLGGNSLSGISKELCSRGIPSPTGKDKWTSCAIDKILSNEKYIGNVMLQKTFRKNVFTDKQTRNQGEKARYVYENNHAGIIDRATFEKVQEEKQNRSNITCSGNGNGKADRTSRRFSSGNTLSGKIQCCECGRNYRRIKTRKGEIIWRCAGQVEHTSNCQSRAIKQSEIDEYLKQVHINDTESSESCKMIEKIVVDKNAFKIIVDSTVLS